MNYQSSHDPHKDIIFHFKLFLINLFLFKSFIIKYINYFISVYKSSREELSDFKFLHGNAYF